MPMSSSGFYKRNRAGKSNTYNVHVFELCGIFIHDPIKMSNVQQHLFVTGNSTKPISMNLVNVEEQTAACDISILMLIDLVKR